MNKKFIVAGVVILLLVSAVGYWIYHSKNQDDKQLTLYGNVDIRQVSLAFENAGRIQSLTVQEGDRVSKGQVLGQLDVNALKIQIAQAEANLDIQAQAVKQQKVGARPEEIAQARAQLTSAQAEQAKALVDYNRVKTIYNDTSGHAISKQELDAAKSKQSTTEASVKVAQAALDLKLLGDRQEQREATLAQFKAAEANLNLLKYQLSQADLRSPVHAIVRARLQEPGDMTTAQKPVYTLALTDPKWIRVYVSETDLSSVTMGEAAQVYTDANPDQAIIGKIGYISSVAEFTPKTVQTEDLRTNLVYEVRIYVDDAKDRLKIGQPVTVKLQKNQAKE